MIRHALLLLTLSLCACDKSPTKPRAAEPRGTHPADVVRAVPTDAEYSSGGEVVAMAGTPARARERLAREAERAGCDVVVIQDEHRDVVTDDKGLEMNRFTVKGDCLKRGAPR